MAAPAELVSTGDSRRSRRAAQTRSKLLEAAAELLTERGYSRLATAAVAERAGVAHGTLFKHFATKSELMAATTELVLDELIGEFSRMAQQFAAQAEPIDQALHAVWSLFRSERLQATLELYVAARTDESLRDALRPIFTTHEVRSCRRHAPCCPLRPTRRTSNPTSPGFSRPCSGAHCCGRSCPSRSSFNRSWPSWIESLERSSHAWLGGGGRMTGNSRALGGLCVVLASLVGNGASANIEPSSYDAKSIAAGTTGMAYLDNPSALAINPANLAASTAVA